MRLEEAIAKSRGGCLACYIPCVGTLVISEGELQKMGALGLMRDNPLPYNTMPAEYHDSDQWEVECRPCAAAFEETECVKGVQDKDQEKLFKAGWDACTEHFLDTLKEDILSKNEEYVRLLEIARK